MTTFSENLQADSAPDQHVESPEDELDAQLRAETAALLADLENSRRETSALIAAHLNQNEEVCEAQANMTSQFEQLQEEAWKLTMFMELESIKQQLAQLSEIRANLDMDASEQPELAAPQDRVLVPTPGSDENVLDVHSSDSNGAPTTTPADGDRMLSVTAAAVEDEGSVAVAVRDISEGETDDEDLQQLVKESEELQQQMDEELQVMQAQLEAVRHEALLVYERKQQLEAELMRMALMNLKEGPAGDSVADDTAAPDVNVPELVDGAQ